MNTVLLVDDDHSYRREVEKKLKAFFAQKIGELSNGTNIDLMTAGDTEQAIALIKENNITLLVTDIEIPAIDGLHLLSYVSEHHQHIPRIVIAAPDHPEFKKQPEDGVVHYIEKPYKHHMLGKKILSILKLDSPGTAISGVSLANFLQILEMEEQSCILKIETIRQETGYFCFKDGKLYDAVFGEYTGEEAAIRMIPLKSNKLRILDLPHPNPKKRISIDYLMPLIARALKVMKKKENISS